MSKIYWAKFSGICSTSYQNSKQEKRCGKQEEQVQKIEKKINCKLKNGDERQEEVVFSHEQHVQS